MNDPISFPCPTCGRTNTRVTQMKARAGGQRRTRRCRNCAAAFWTQDNGVETFDCYQPTINPSTIEYRLQVERYRHIRRLVEAGGDGRCIEALEQARRRCGVSAWR